MKVSDLVEKFGLAIWSGRSGLNREVTGGYASDLLSDVMGNAQEGQVWITLQTHQNVMAIASLKDLAAVIIINDHEPDEETIVRSEEEGIPLLGTSWTAFDMAGRLYKVLAKS